jgi:CHAD domain-containing protein
MTGSGSDASASSGTGRGGVRPLVKGGPVHLDAAMAPEHALRLVATAAWRQVLANQPGVMTGDDPEHVHQMRVALRRLRSALRLFAGNAVPPVDAEVAAGLEALGALLGEVRDLDVLSRLLRPSTHAADMVDTAVVAAALAPRAALARERLLAFLVSAAHARSVAGVEAWVNAEVAQNAGEDLSSLARHRLGDLHKRVMHGVARYGTLGDRARHRFRIDVKRTRYGAEVFGVLYPTGRVAPYLSALAQAQDLLGCLTDINMAQRFLRDVGIDRAVRAALVRHWRRRHGPSGAELARAFSQIKSTGGFWKRPR